MLRTPSRWGRGMAVVVATVTAGALGMPAVVMAAPAAPAAGAAQTAAAQTITVDGTSPGRTFDGLGGQSAGATTALLMDYPAKQRSQILDYLFKPDYGASLQILKVEIGGDTDSTDGSETSHEPEPGQITCNAGYEWWLMEQAKARNPAIRLYGLQYGAPAWVGAGTSTIFTSQDITYVLDWLGCARRHGLTISYLGGWNEHNYFSQPGSADAVAEATWFVDLRSALDASGYSGVQLVADDAAAVAPYWGAAGALASDPALDAAVSEIGQHDPCNATTGAMTCPATATALGLNKPLWNSEQGVNVYNASAADLAREINRDYVDGKITALIAWSLEWSAYASLPLQGTSLMLANTPWSGTYTAANTLIWAMAHTTQFARPGWRYLDSGSVPLSGGGSVATLRSPVSGDWSSIAETSSATAAQTVTYQVGGGLSGSTVHVWATNTASADPRQWFAHVADIRPAAGSFTITLQPGFIYSLTTTTGQHKGNAAPPPARPMKLPYRDTFNSYPAGVTPRLFSNVGGEFDTQRCVGRPGMCLQQEVTAQPFQSQGVSNYPLTVVGDPTSWSDYQVSVDAMLQQPGYVELDGRSPATAGRTAGIFSSPPGYHFRIDDQGSWSIYQQNTAISPAVVTLASGTAPRGFGVGRWHTLGLAMRGQEITATLDGRPLATVVDPVYSTGQVGLEVSPWDKAQFDNLSVTKLPSAPQAQPPQLGTLTPDPAPISAPGGSVQITASVTNPGHAPASAIDAQLTGPAGWTATPVTGAPRRLPGGQTAPLAWQLTAPAAEIPGSFQASLTVTYTEAGLRWTTVTTTLPITLGGTVPLVPQSQMTATATSSQPGYDPSQAIDGNPATLWSAAFSPVKPPLPQSITLDLGGSYDVRQLLYLPRQDGNPSGTIASYRVYTSTDGTTFTQVASGTWAADATAKTASFSADGVRYIRLEDDGALNSTGVAAEINVVGRPST